MELKIKLSFTPICQYINECIFDFRINDKITSIIAIDERDLYKLEAMFE